MDDSEREEIEQRLRRYRPVGPPAALRARIVAAERLGLSAWWIWAPAALSAAAALVLAVLSANARRDLMVEFAQDSGRDAVVNAVVAEIGGGEPTRALVARLIELDEQSAASAEQGIAAAEVRRHE